MTTTKSKISFTYRTGIFIIGLVALLALLYVARGIIVPFIFAVIIAIVLHPVVQFFVRRKLNRVISIIITLLLSFLIIAFLGILIASQVARLSESWPLLIEKLTLASEDFIVWLAGYLDINQQSIRTWLAEFKTDLLGLSGSAFSQTMVGIGNSIVVILLIPVYVFMLLFYQPILIEFIRRLFGSDNKSKVNEIITQIKTVIQQYLVGLALEILIVATLEIIALLLLGIEYALLLGIIGALLNLIPYIGGLVAVALPMMVALVTKTSPWYAVYVMVIYYVIQLIDNNYIVPRIVASKVKINALFSIIAVLVGNIIWGVPGMFLSIPLLAIIKLICDHIESLKPWGFLLGDTMPPIFKKIKKSSK
ncbi:MAG: AI-2E family transporter [Bacteroidetes bacterium GWF2_43_63]|nr:MAG: AI-2E family transporter [Bacteroidetes bacterium GWE2_42_42]OFY55572.1 MAG: AI-2E family transporter [Bacteroidetes bacterium GWF2_43_63]HBG71584.1 AI-2E family transporter [Bacteroidales bacterium]HCB62117.1 AI-2E family transporter [Bacteroidales bacterium]HCY22345.1 AI-2E family transporter [Bacteroidales bacterium]